MKTKFNPKDVPSWCKWIAVDESGRCWGFENKPDTKSSRYNGNWDTRNIDKAVELYEGKPPKNWKDELYTWK